MAMDWLNRRLFLGCRSKVMAVMNAETGQVITTLPIGDHVDATAFDAETRMIFNPNGEGTVTVIHQETPDAYSIAETVKTFSSRQASALDPKTHKLFLSTAEAGQFKVLVVGKKIVNEDLPEIVDCSCFSWLRRLHAFPFANASAADPARRATVATKHSLPFRRLRRFALP